MQGLATYINPANLGTSKAVAVPDASAFLMTRQYGQDWTFNKAEKTMVGLGFDLKLNDMLTVRGGFRYGAMWRSYAFVDATLTNNKGNYTEIITEDRPQTEYNRAEYLPLDARVPVWTLVNNFTAGYTGTDFVYGRGSDINSKAFASTIDMPTVVSNPNSALGPLNSFNHQIWDNLIFADRIEFLEKFTLLGGVNYAQLKDASWNQFGVTTARYDAAGTSPAVGLTWRFLPEVSAYASYMQALEAGDTAPSTAVNANQVLAPSVSTQYEGGVKSTYGGVTATAALFRIEKVNAELNPNNNIYMQDGREIHQGLEVMFTGKVLPDLAAVGGFTFLHAYVDKATANPLTNGKTPVNVPEQEARLRLEYALPCNRDIKVAFGPEFLGSARSMSTTSNISSPPRSLPAASATSVSCSATKFRRT